MSGVENLEDLPSGEDGDGEEEEGKTALVISIGCTGGHHRSVAVAHALADRIRAQGWPVTESHRDLGRN